MSTILVVYGTSSGCTAGIAEKLAEVLSAAGNDATAISAADAPALDGYDAVIVGSGVRAGQWHSSARTWVTTNAEALKGLPVALFTCGLTTADAPQKAEEVRAYTDALLESTGITPVDVGVFAGWNNPRTFSMPERLIMKVMKAPEGDFRDWDAIAEWAHVTAGKLGVSA